jgi:hypothetical protein
LQYKIEQLKVAWQEFAIGIFESDLIKFGVSILTKFLEVVNNATSKLDGMGNTISKIISIVALFKIG